MGLGCSADQYFRHCARHGSRECFDQFWAVNSLASIFHVDLCFHMDDFRIQEMRAAACVEETGMAEMLRWFRENPDQKGYTSRAHPDYAGFESYPLEFVLNASGGPCYFNSTPSYALGLAFASHFENSPIAPVTELTIFGCDFQYAPGIWKGEKGRGCMEYWIGRLQGQGKTQVKLPKQTWLMDAHQLQPYGYDTVYPKISDENGSCKVVFEELPQEQWPTVEAIEERYAKR